MAKLIKLEATKTYASPENAAKAFEKLFGEEDVRYIILRDEATGRYFPAALGEKALHLGVHFHFHVLG